MGLRLGSTYLNANRPGKTPFMEGRGHMTRCSRWVIVGFAALVVGLAFFAFHYWYASQYIPDFPQRVDGKRFIHTPRGDAQLNALIGAVFVILGTSLVTLVGVVRGPRTWACLVAGLVGPVVVAAPFAAVFAIDLISTAQSASFPCALAKSGVEKTICGNAELSTLDEHLGRYYAAARTVLKSADSCLQTDQRNWIRTQRDPCGDAECLRQAYLRRLAELDPLQPGVTSVKNIELPSTKALMWIVPAALDQVAAPVNKQAKPLVAQGAILDEVSGGDGYVLRAGDGRRLLIVPLMFLESPTTETLASLARLRGTEYEVRGYAEVSADGSAHFAPSRCVFVYRSAR